MLLAARHLSSVLFQAPGYLPGTKAGDLLPVPLLFSPRSPFGAAEVHRMAKHVTVRYRAGKFPLFMRSLVPLSGSAMFKFIANETRETFF